MSERTTADYIAETLAQVGVTSVYVYPGGTIAPLLNAFDAIGVGIEVFKHEQGAVYAALAKARLTGKVQVAMVTSGPGVTNALTPLADGYYDSTPLLLISGQIGTGDLLSGRKVRQRGFQEVPTSSLVADICKDVVCPSSVEEAVRSLPALVNTAIGGRPGPVVLDLPMDVQRAACNAPYDDSEFTQGTVAASPPKATLSEVCAGLAASKRPVILLGQGALSCAGLGLHEELARRANAFVVSSLPGLGAISSQDRHFLGFIGHTGHEVANRAVHETDFLLVLGARLDVRQTGTVVDKFVPNGRIAWVNNDSSELEYPRVAVEWAIHADVKDCVEEILEGLPETVQNSDDEWKNAMRELRDRRTDDAGIPEWTEDLAPREVLTRTNEYMRDRKGVVVTGVGCHQQWAARHLPFGPDGWQLLTSAGHGAMGYDLPSAIGAGIADPERTVLCVVGDGSFLMNIQELASLVERRLNVKILLLNNHRLGIVSQFQRITWGVDHASGRFATPDFVAIARGFGVEADRVERREQLETRLDWLWSKSGPVLLEVLIDHDADVVPMLLAGQTMDRMWGGQPR